MVSDYFSFWSCFAVKNLVVKGFKDMPTIFVDKSVENESLACIIAYKSRLAWACLKNKPKINFF
ncbi:hypothetical protein BHC53_06020 [Snodgrassella alvi]|uniref:Uncharacterized protein n=1 Tax=Snodgrassella alvi TaxID=1196083 RepID=A0A2N9X7Z9_9NEIS|nr:hypothetical protein BHC54_04435 [Snodgrassella alvi]PIT41675.1 hypothetical protein BHC53_06020 [Snodgrassella alvi]